MAFLHPKKECIFFSGGYVNLRECSDPKRPTGAAQLGSFLHWNSKGSTLTPFTNHVGPSKHSYLFANLDLIYVYLSISLTALIKKCNATRSQSFVIFCGHIIIVLHPTSSFQILTTGTQDPTTPPLTCTTSQQCPSCV